MQYLIFSIIIIAVAKVSYEYGTGAPARAMKRMIRQRQNNLPRVK